MSEKPYQRAVAQLLEGEPARWSKQPPGFRRLMRNHRKTLQAGVKATDEAEVQNRLVLSEYRSPRLQTWAFVHPSTFYAGQWRFSLFDERGWFSHEDGYDTPKDAFYSMYQGYSVHDPGALQRAMVEPAWAIGMQRLDSIGRRNKCSARGDWEGVAYFEHLLSLLEDAD